MRSPLPRQLRFHLEVKLKAVGAASEAKRLPGIQVARGEQSGLRWKIEGFSVPVHDAHLAQTRSTQHRIRQTVLGQRDLPDTDLLGSPRIDRRSQSMRHQLRSQAHTQ